MARVTTLEVKEIIETGKTDLTVFITAGGILTDRVEQAGIDSGSTVPAATLKEIERWLSAHFTAIDDQRATKEGVGGGSARVDISYQVKLGLNLQVTHYGQQAIILDPTGKLNSITKGIQPSAFGFVGGDVSDELTGS